MTTTLSNIAFNKTSIGVFLIYFNFRHVSVVTFDEDSALVLVNRDLTSPSSLELAERELRLVLDCDVTLVDRASVYPTLLKDIDLLSCPLLEFTASGHETPAVCLSYDTHVLKSLLMLSVVKDCCSTIVTDARTQIVGRHSNDVENPESIAVEALHDEDTDVNTDSVVKRSMARATRAIQNAEAITIKERETLLAELTTLGEAGEDLLVRAAAAQRLGRIVTEVEQTMLNECAYRDKK